MKISEANIDALVGTTHHYAGLSFGNVASEKNALSVSNPKKAALQGLEKMKLLHDLGVPQLFMPPPLRPDTATMAQLGFRDIAEVPLELVPQLCSASAMWAANAATVSAAVDTPDGKVHITPANLVSKFHRSIESTQTSQYLQQVFPAPGFIHHAPLPAHALFADEGAANQMWLYNAETGNSLTIFVYGGATAKYPARQSRLASEAVARLHGLDAGKTLFLQQHQDAIDAGVFHNDVIAMSNGPLLIYHEMAYRDFTGTLPADFTVVKITQQELSLEEAVASYFFNSQIVTLPSGEMVAVAARECEESRATKACFERLVRQGHIASVYYMDLRESMQNGGGPACLRLRVPLTVDALKTVNVNFWLNDLRYNQLIGWIEKHYRDRLGYEDLRDPSLAAEARDSRIDLAQRMEIQLDSA